MAMDSPRSQTALDGRRIAAVMGITGIPLVLVIVLLSDGVTVRLEYFAPAVVVGTLIASTFATRPLDGGRAAALLWLQFGVATVTIVTSGWTQSPLGALLPLLLLYAALTQRLEWFLPTMAVTVVTSAVASVADPGAPPEELAEFVFTTAVMLAIGLTVNFLIQGRAERVHLLAEREQRFRGLAENADDGVFLLRLAPTPRFEYVNPALANMLGVSVEDVYADPDLPTNLVHEDDRHLRAIGRGGTSEPIDVRIVGKGGPRWVSIMTQALQGPSGDLHSVQGVVRDITSRRETEQALSTALDQQRAAAAERSRIDAMRDGFLRAVTHEVRTPLTAIRGMSELILTRGDRVDPAVHHDLVRRMDANARRLEMLLADVLEAARGPSPDGDPAVEWTEPIDLAEMAQQAVGLLDLGDRDVTVQMPQDALSVPARQVRRILDVFLHNAARHTPPGTPVEVSGRLTADGMLDLAVADRGPGVDREDHDAVFRPFHQGSHAVGQASPGTGIGLTIVNQYAELLGGRAWVEDRDGGGAVFHATLRVDHARP